MGMDVYGKKALSEEGKYFRNNVWWWRPLANYCQRIAPAIASKCKHWQTNDGAGLNAEDSVLLADALQAELDSGRTQIYEDQYRARLAAMPDEKCWLCGGTGVRSDIPLRGPGTILGGRQCNGCNGSGHRRPDETHYPFEAENVREFVTFLRACGGFEIC